ncbi:MAG: hypothetical protein HFI38_05540 [Lachnospiraceae bacterium]|jgi:uncharacterized membrane protein|nr:hypothetical protein [Lachnospiraceae bacterium]
MERLCQWLAYFYIYCICGWIWETSYVSVCEKRFVNRGFLHGPVIPLYGSGAVAMLFLALPVKDSIMSAYLVGVVGATLLELITGWAMEKLFKVKYWDYSRQRFQYRGYICLSSSLFWGVLTVALVRWVHGPVERLVRAQPGWLLIMGTLLFSAGFLLDLAVSVREAVDLRRVLVALSGLHEEIETAQKELQREVGVRVERLTERVEERKEVLAGHMEETKEQFCERLEERHKRLEERLSQLREQREIWLGEFQLAHRRLRRRHPSATTGRLEELLSEVKRRRGRGQEEDRTE